MPSSTKFVPDYASMVSVDYISKELPEHVRTEVLAILMTAARRRLDERIVAGEKPQKLEDGSLGWTQGMQWGPPFEGDNAWHLIYIEVKAIRVREPKPEPEPETLIDVQRERDALRAEVKGLRKQLDKHNRA